MNRQPSFERNPKAPVATPIDEVRGDFWYGASRYPLHDSQLAELRATLEPQLAAAAESVRKLMTQWSGGFTLKVDMMTFDLIGDGWNVGVGSGNPQRFVDVALAETVAEDK